jgi:hypothetical protein
MEQNTNENVNNNSNDAAGTDRREVMQKLGRFAMYAAPFTVLALTKKADAATGHGPAARPRP